MRVCRSVTDLSLTGAGVAAEQLKDIDECVAQNRSDPSRSEQTSDQIYLSEYAIQHPLAVQTKCLISKVQPQGGGIGGKPRCAY